MKAQGYNRNLYVLCMMLSMLTLNVHAQDKSERYVDIPDEVLKEYLLKTYDKDGDKKLSIQEAEAVTYIGIYSNETEYGIRGCNVGSLKGIEMMPNLTCIECDNLCTTNFRIKEVDVSKNNKLEVLLLPGNELKSIDVSHNPNLQVLDITGNMIKNLDVSSNIHLNKLSVGFTDIENINISHLKELEYFNCMNSSIKKLDVSGLSKLKYLECSWCCMEELNIGYKENLRVINCSCNKLSEIDMSRARPIITDKEEMPDYNFKDNNLLKYIKVWKSFVDDCTKLVIIKDEDTKWMLPNGVKIDISR